MSAAAPAGETRYGPKLSLLFVGLAIVPLAIGFSRWLDGPNDLLEYSTLALSWLSAYPQWLLIKRWQTVVITAETISGPGFPFGRITIPIDHIDLPRSRNGIDIWARCGTRIRIIPAILGRRSYLEMLRMLGLDGPAA